MQEDRSIVLLGRQDCQVKIKFFLATTVLYVNGRLTLTHLI